MKSSWPDPVELNPLPFLERILPTATLLLAIPIVMQSSDLWSASILLAFYVVFNFAISRILRRVETEIFEQVEWLKVLFIGTYIAGIPFFFDTTAPFWLTHILPVTRACLVIPKTRSRFAITALLAISAAASIYANSGDLSLALEPLVVLMGIGFLFNSVINYFGQHLVWRIDQLNEAHERLEKLNRKLAQEVDKQTIEVRNQKDFLHSILDHLPLAMFCKDYSEPVGKFVGWNRSAEELWGLKEGEVLDKSDFDFFPEDQAKFFQAKDQETLQSGDMVFIPEEPVESPTVGTRYVRTWKVPLLNSKKKPQFLLGISQDITEIKNTTKELEKQRLANMHASRLASLGEMANRMAHEINNPLAIIQGNADQLQRSVGRKPDQIAEIVPKKTDKIIKAVSRIKAIVDGINTSSKSDSKNLAESIPASQILEDAIKRVKDGFQVARIDLEFDPPPDTTLLDCQPSQVTQVFINLLNNAKEALSETSEAHKWVRVEAKNSSDERILVRISDSGPGIPEENQERIFEPFFTTRGVEKGNTGLGLSICRGIIEAHGGTLTLDPEGAHTTFVVEIPIQKHARAAA